MRGSPFQVRRWTSPRSLWVTAFWWAACLLAPARAPAQEADPDPNIPVIVINAASVERLLNQAIVTFETAGRPELSETIGGALGRVNDLEGLDRDQSMGIMVFLNGITPEGVAYVPVKNLDDLLKTATVGPVTTKRVGEDRLELQVGGRTIHGRVQGGYAFVADNSAALDRDFRDPARMTGGLSRAYDLSVSVNLKSIAPATRDLFLTLMRANNENNLQRRDNEPVAAHKMRRAAAVRNQEVIEQLITQGETLTIGWSVSAADKTAALEIVVTATPGSEFAEYFNELKGNRSRFANLLSSENPLTASFAWRLDKSARKMFREMISATEVQLFRSIAATDGDADASGAESGDDAIHRLIQVLQATGDSGTLDAVFQFQGEPSTGFVLIGGVRVSDAVTLSGALSEILTRLNGNDALQEVKLNVFSHQGVDVHRLAFKQTGSQAKRIYGGEPKLYLGVGDDIFWLALGNPEVTPTELRRAIDKADQPIAEGVVSAPFQMVMNFNRWMDIFDPNQREGFAARARGAFSKGGDALRIEARPIEDGIRTRITMDEAFIRLVGQQIAAQFDRNQPEDRDQPEE
ncbi:MAG: hypothetical protein ACKV0T_09960 [Planctomycetales bacterium]